jgi:hypothetical protein
VDEPLGLIAPALNLLTQRRQLAFCVGKPFLCRGQPRPILFQLSEVKVIGARRLLLDLWIWHELHSTAPRVATLDLDPKTGPEPSFCYQLESVLRGERA